MMQPIIYGASDFQPPFQMRGILESVRDVLCGSSRKRSSAWPALRERHLLSHASCAACGGTDALSVHHLLPFHLFPELELDESNLLTLCESGPAGMNCHLLCGHGGRWKDYVAKAARDARRVQAMILGRTKG